MTKKKNDEVIHFTEDLTGVLNQTARVRTMFNYVPRKGITFYNKSRTIPNQSMSVEAVVKRYASGLPVHQYHQEPVYNGEIELPNFNAMDKIEMDLFMKENKTYLDQLRQEVKNAQDKQDLAYQEKAKKDQEEKLRNEIKEQLKKEKTDPQ